MHFRALFSSPSRYFFQIISVIFFIMDYFCNIVQRFFKYVRNRWIGFFIHLKLNMNENLAMYVGGGGDFQLPTNIEPELNQKCWRKRFGKFLLFAFRQTLNLVNPAKLLCVFSVLSCSVNSRMFIELSGQILSIEKKVKVLWVWLKTKKIQRVTVTNFTFR